MNSQKTDVKTAKSTGRNVRKGWVLERVKEKFSRRPWTMENQQKEKQKSPLEIYEKLVGQEKSSESQKK